MPQEAFRKIWEDTIAGLGDYIGLDETTQDTESEMPASKVDFGLLLGRVQ